MFFLTFTFVISTNKNVQGQEKLWAFPPLRSTNDVPTPDEAVKTAFDANLKPFFAHFNHQGGP